MVNEKSFQVPYLRRERKSAWRVCVNGENTLSQLLAARLGYVDTGYMFRVVAHGMQKMG